ncbi:MAG: tannase/feruloyl esterase family alpha/beta hydrolase [Chloroflexi bacterium]|nr:tannase/feruloyl esterase family alpha/beta hydrolase [Chloroflexota bacterium]
MDTRSYRILLASIASIALVALIMQATRYNGAATTYTLPGGTPSYSLFLPLVAHEALLIATPTATHTPTHTPAATLTDTPTSTRTDTPTATRTPNYTPTHTPAATLTDTPTSTRTRTPTATHTRTRTPTHTPTATPIIVDPGQIPCADLTNLELPDTTITVSEIVWPGWQSPGPYEQVQIDRIICRVTGRIAPSINFELWLPLTTGDKPWNGRFNGVGNGGLAGYIRYSRMLAALKNGYATAGTDTGHQADATDGRWMVGHPELLVDFSYRAIHEMTLDAQAVILAYYGQGPQYSYFTGCSGGGQQALAEAQRYPADYDGLVAGAPANYRTHSWPGEIWPPYVTHRSAENVIPAGKLSTIYQGALAACDANDGLVDGVISDPLHCRFDPAVLLCQGQDGADCLTAGEVDSVRLIYAGLNDPTTGEQFWPGLEPGSEVGWIGWGALLPEPFDLPLAYFKYLLFAENSGWDWKSFNFTDPQDFAILTDADARYGPILNAINPDLSTFQALGGKLIMYHGWADQQVAPRNSINYYNSVVSTMGSEAETQEFLRLYMVPGMMHCGSGTGPPLFDTLAAVRQWVEQGIAPAEMVSLDGARLLCLYPQVARYTGDGSTNDTKDFACVKP